MSFDPSAPELTILMPCLNEAEAIGTCIKKAFGYLERSGVKGEVLIADNGSTDGSQEIARELGARVVPVTEKGYGAALIGGIAAARGRFIIMGDADDSYDFSQLDGFLAKLREGSALVVGNRFKGGIAPGAMPVLHRWLGNPALSFIGRTFFKAGIGDFHCGLRGFDAQAMRSLKLRATGMEFASEMIVRARLWGLSIAEVPTTLKKDARSRPPHLRTWRDGWRHLRFLLMFAPRWLFFYPGLALIFAGTVAVAPSSAGTGACDAEPQPRCAHPPDRGHLDTHRRAMHILRDRCSALRSLPGLAAGFRHRRTSSPADHLGTGADRGPSHRCAGDRRDPSGA